MSVRTPGYQPRRPASRRVPALVAGAGLVLLVGGLALAGAGVVPGLPGASPIARAPSESPTSGPPATSGDPAATPAVTAPPDTPAPTPRLERVAIVPVTHFRSPVANSSFRDVEAVLAGTSGRYDALELVASEADGILAALGMSRPADPTRLVLADDPAQLAEDLAATRKRLAFLRADEVTPRVRALSWGRDALFGVDRVATLGDWPLVAELPIRDAAAPTASISPETAAPSRGPGSSAEPAASPPPAESPDPYDPATAWTLVAGGDILLDRGVYKTIRIDGRGIDFPFDGGTAEITGRCKDCSPLGWDTPYTRRTGNAGVVRALLQGADLTIANFENPAPNQFRFHTSGTVFTADPALIEGLANAGIDWVSLANNHIRDAGGPGILQTIANLEKHGLMHGGAGENLDAARTPSMLEAGGTGVAILAYDAIAKGYAAGPDRIGSAPLSGTACREDVRKARAAGAEVVIVFPHWGTEYDPTPFEGQQKAARACLDAGADMIIGNHAHWAGAIEVYKGKPIWYALGNFVFDQTWSEPTMEGITLELTFSGAELRQVRMRPHIILDKAQPNFLDPNDDGKVVMGQIFQASKGLLAW